MSTTRQRRIQEVIPVRRQELTLHGVPEWLQIVLIKRYGRGPISADPYGSFLLQHVTSGPDPVAQALRPALDHWGGLSRGELVDFDTQPYLSLDELEGRLGPFAESLGLEWQATQDSPHCPGRTVRGLILDPGDDFDEVESRVSRWRPDSSIEGALTELVLAESEWSMHDDLYFRRELVNEIFIALPATSGRLISLAMQPCMENKVTIRSAESPHVCLFSALVKEAKATSPGVFPWKRLKCDYKYSPPIAFEGRPLIVEFAVPFTGEFLATASLK